MTAIVAGQGLGLFNGSLSQLNGFGADGRSRIGNGNDQAYVNAINGNLVLQSQDDYLASLGLDLSMVRTYNSQGLLDDDNGDNWRLSFHKRLENLPAIGVFTDITRVGNDGHRATFVYDAGKGYWVSTDGSGAHDTLQRSGANWVYQDSTQGVTETYDGGGRLLSVQDRDGNTQTYGYTGSLLTSIQDASGQTTTFTYNTAGGLNQLTEIRINSLSVDSVRVRYAYDGSNRLQQVRVDLTNPLDATPDASTYITTYTYDGASRRVASITQSDGSSLSIEYVQVGADYRVAALTTAVTHAGDSRRTSFSYDTLLRQTTVTDPLGGVTTYTYDSANRLTKVEDPAVNGVRSVTDYAYDAQSNVSQVTTRVGASQNRVVRYTYDANGNLTRSQDDLGNTVDRTYNVADQLLTETSYLVPDPDLAGPLSPSTPLITRYVYDGEQHLRFVVSPDKRVTEHRYNAAGDRILTVRYTADLYSGSAYAESDLAGWVSTSVSDKSKAERTDFAYDFRSQLSSVSRWTDLNPDGTPVSNSTSGVTLYFYDAAGQLLKTVDPRGASIVTGQPFVTSYFYDGLGRVTSAVDATGRTTTTQYDDANNKIVIVSANGLYTTQTYNKAGELTQLKRQLGTSGTDYGTTSYAYDAKGQLRMVTGPTGERSYQLYDARGWKTAEISALGELTETVYNDAGQVVRTIRYAQRIPPGRLATLVDSYGRPVAATVEQLLGRVNALPLIDLSISKPGINDSSTAVPALLMGDTVIASPDLSITDPGGVLTQSGGGMLTGAVITIDSPPILMLLESLDVSAGALAGTGITQSYSNNTLTLTGNGSYATYEAILRTLTYHHLVPILQLLAPRQVSVRLNDGSAVSAPVATIRVNAPGIPAGDPDFSNTGVSTSTAGGLLWSGETDANNRVENWIYDAAGRVVFKAADETVSAVRQRYLTEIVYDGAGRVVGEKGYAKPIATTIALTEGAIRTALAQPGALDAANDRTVRTFFNDDGQVIGTLDGEGYLTKSDYDTAGRLIQQTAFANATDPAQRASGTLAALIPAASDKDAISYQIYDGRGQRRGIFKVEGASATQGYLVECLYDRAGNKVSEVQYSQKLSYNAGQSVEQVRASLTGAALSRTQSVVWVYDPLNRVTSEQQYAYNASGSAILVNRSDSTYDAVTGFLTKVDRAVGSADLRTSTMRYDDLGRLTQSLEGEGSAALAAAGSDINAQNAVWSQYAYKHDYDLAGRRVKTTDPNGKATYFWYDRQGRLQYTVNAAGEVTQTTYNAFGEVAETIQYAQRVNWLQDFSAGSAGLTLGSTPTYWRVENGRLVGVSQSNGSVIYPAAVGTRSYNLADGQMLFRAEVNTGSTPSGRLMLIGAEGGAGGAARRLMASFAGNQVRVNRYDGASYTEVTLGAVRDNTDYVVETLVTSAGSTLYVYEKGTSRADGYSYNFATTWTAASTTAYVAGQPGASTSTVYVDNLTETRLAPTVNGSTLRDPVSDRVESFGYSLRGLLNRQTDANAIITREQIYNAFGNVESRKFDVGDASALIRTDTFTYDRKGLLKTSVRDSGGLGYQDSYLYDAFGRQTQRTDPRSGVWKTSYDRWGREISTTDARNKGTATTYDAFSRVLSQTDRLGNTTSYAYDDVLRTTTVTTPEGIVTTRTRNAHGQQISITLNNGSATETTTYQYDKDGRLVSTVLDAGGSGHLNLTATSDYDRAGLLTATVDRNGVRTAYTYDAANRVLTRTVDPTSYTTPSGTVISNPSGLGLQTQYAYDAFGENVRTTDAEGVVTETVFDRKGQATAVIVDTVPRAGQPTPLKIATVYTYDRRGERLTMREGVQATGSSGSLDTSGTALKTTQYSYDKLGRRSAEVVDPGSGKLNITTQYFYDGNDNLVRKVDANGNTWRYLYDENNRLVYTVDPLGSVSESRYDDEGRVVRTIRYAAAIATGGLTDASLPSAVASLVVPNSATDRTTWQIYDDDGRRAYTVELLGGTYVDAGAVTGYIYDAAGRVIDTVRYATPIVTASLPANPRPVDITVALNASGYGEDFGTNLSQYTYYPGSGTGVQLVNRRLVMTGQSASTSTLLSTRVYNIGAGTPRSFRSEFTPTVTTGSFSVGAESSPSDQRIHLANFVNGQIKAYTRTGATINETVLGTFAAGKTYVVEVVVTPASSTLYVYEKGQARVTGVSHSFAAAWTTARARVQQNAGNGEVAYVDNLTETLSLPDSSTADRHTRTVYDAAGRAIYEVDALYQVVQNSYDGNGNLLQRREYNTAIAPATVVNQASLDNAANLARMDGKDRITSFAYDAANRQRFTSRLLEFVSATSTYRTYVTEARYDKVGRVVDNYRYLTPATFNNLSQTAAVMAAAVAGIPDYQRDRNGYDAAGRLISVIDAENKTQSYSYDLLGNKKTYTNQNNATWNYNYDAAGRLTDEISPLVEVTSVAQGIAATGVAGANASTVSSDGQFVYVTGSNSVGVFKRQADGSLTFVQTVSGGQGGVPALTGASALALSGDGAFLYVLASSDNSLSVFSRNATTGQLTFVQRIQDGVGGVDGLAGAQSLAVIGNHLYVASEADNSLTHFNRNATTGQLTFFQKITVAGAAAVAAAPDGISVHVISSTTGNLVSYRRNATTGSLTSPTTVSGATSFLTGPQALIVSPDNKHVYAVGRVNNSLAYFVRNTSTGVLTYQSTLVNGISASNMVEPTEITMTPDGAYIIVSSGRSNSLAVFSRNSTSGLPTFVSSTAIGTGLRASINPVSGDVYVQDPGSNSLARHSRSGGTLTLVQTVRDGTSASQAASANASVVTHLTYDGLGNVRHRIENYSPTDPTKSRVTTYAYDAAGRQKETRNGDRVTIGSVTYGSFAAGTADALSAVVSFDAQGNATVLRDAGGKYSYKIYDQLGRVVLEVDADGNVTGYGYDAFGDLILVKRFDGPVSPGHVAGTPYTFLEVFNLLGAFGTGREIQTVYDALGRKITITQDGVYTYDAMTDSGTVASPTTTFGYDAFGAQISESRLARPGVFDTRYFYYDQVGNQVAEVDSMGYLTQRQYSATGRLTSQKEWNNQLAPGTWNAAEFTAPLAVAASVTAQQQPQELWASDFANSGINGFTSGVLGTNFTIVSGALNVAASSGSGTTHVRLEGTRTYPLSDPERTTFTFDFRVNGLNHGGARYMGIGNWNGSTPTAATTGFYLAISGDSIYVHEINGTVVNSGPRASLSANVDYKLEIVTDARGATLYLHAVGTPRGSAYQYRSDFKSTSNVMRAQILARQGGGSTSTLTITRVKEFRGTEATVSAASLDARQTANVRETAYNYDRLDRQISVTRKGVLANSLAVDGSVLTAIGDQTTSMVYDGVGNLIKTVGTDGATTLNFFDALGRQVATVGPAAPTKTPDGATDNAFSRLTVFAYDAFGNELLQRRYAYGTHHTAVQASVSDRPTAVQASAAADVVTYRYYDILGRAVQDVDAEGYSSFTAYDAYGNVARTEQTFLRADNTVGQKIFEYGYNGRGLMIEVRERLESGGMLSRTATYNPFGEVISKSVSGAETQTGEQPNLNGTFETYRYDRTGRRVYSNENGVGTVTLYDLKGNATAQITSPTIDLLSLIPAAGGQSPEVVANLTSGVRRTEIVYDANGRAVLERQPSFTSESLNLESLVGLRFGLSTTRLPFGATPTARVMKAGTSTWINLPVTESNNVWTFSQSGLTIGEYRYEVAYTMPGSTVPVAAGSGTVFISDSTLRTGISVTRTQIGGIWHFVFSATPGSGVNLSGMTAVEFGTSTLATGPERYSVRNLGGGSYAVPVPSTSIINTFFMRAIGINSAQDVIYNINTTGTVQVTPAGAAQSVINGLFRGRIDATATPLPTNIVITKVEYKPAGAGANQSWTNLPLPNPISLDALDFESGEYEFRVTATTSTGTPINFSTILAYGVPIGNASGVVTGTYRHLSTNSQSHDAVATNVQSTVYSLTSTRTYDRWGNVLQQIDAAGVTTQYSYDEFNRLIEERQSSVSAYTNRKTSFAVTPKTQTAYDLQGRVIGVTDPNANLSTWEYDLAGNLTRETSGSGKSTRYTYDAEGRKVTETDDLNFTSTYRYDRRGLLTSLQRPAANSLTLYSYDALGNRVNDNNQITYVYDPGGRILSQTRPLSNGNQQKISYVYDAMGRQVRETDANGVFKTWTYDHYGRLITQRTPTGKANASDVSITTGNLSTYTYNALTGEKQEEVLQAGSGTHVRRYDYYENGLIKRVSEYLGSASSPTTAQPREKQVEYLYDSGGRLLHQRSTTRERTRSLSQDTHYTYDTAGRLRLAADTDSLAEYFYDAAGNRKLIDAQYYGPGSSRPVTRLHRYDYDADQRIRMSLEGDVATDASGNPTGLSTTAGNYYEYDRAGRRVRQIDYSGNYSLNGSVYDTLGLLVDTLAVPGRQTQILHNNFDSNGRFSVQSLGNNNGSQGTALSSRTYDVYDRVLNHSILSGGGNSNAYSYYADGTVRAVTSGSTTGTYTYDKAGNLTGMTGNGTYSYIYKLDGPGYLQSQITVNNSSGTNTTVNSYDLRGRFVQTTLNGTFNGSAAYDAQGRNAGRTTYHSVSGVGTSIYGDQPLYFGDQLLGFYEKSPSASFPAYVHFGFAPEPISREYPAISPGQYVVAAGDTLRSIALSVYGDAGLWYLIGDANNIGFSDSALQVGQNLKIPNRIVEARNTSQTFRPVSQLADLGDLTPPLPQPPAKKCNTFATALVAVVAVVATVYGAGVVATSGTFGSGVFTAGANALAAGNVGAAAVGGAVGSVASQATAIALDSQADFDFGQVAAGALGAAAAAGIGGALKGTALNTLQRGFVQGALTSAANNGIGVVLGQQSQFSWASVAASAITSSVATAGGLDLNRSYLNNRATPFSFGQVALQTVQNSLYGVARQSIALALGDGGRIDLRNIAADAFGNALGNSIVGAIQFAGLPKEVQNMSAADRQDRKSTRLNSSHNPASRMPSSA
jgi:YD repeat-containing protein